MEPLFPDDLKEVMVNPLTDEEKKHIMKRTMRKIAAGMPAVALTGKDRREKGRE